jgi:hypothetical protein
MKPAIKEPSPPKRPANPPKEEPNRSRTPYPVDEPPDPPGSEPDYFPGKPVSGDLPKM